MRRFESRLIAWLAAHTSDVLRIGLGIVFLWFGVLKFKPELCPAEALIEATVGSIVSPGDFFTTLAVWECTIGMGLLLGWHLRFTLCLLLAHMTGTFLPLITCPERVWTTFPYAWTLEGQYIVKNIVLVGAALAVAGAKLAPVRLPRRSRSKSGTRSKNRVRRPFGPMHCNLGGGAIAQGSAHGARGSVSIPSPSSSHHTEDGVEDGPIGTELSHRGDHTGTRAGTDTGVRVSGARAGDGRRD